MDARAERNAATTAIEASDPTGGEPSRSMDPMAAARTAGMLMRKETRKASTPEYPLNSRAEVVRPDLEIPGMAERP